MINTVTDQGGKGKKGWPWIVVIRSTRIKPTHAQLEEVSLIMFKASYMYRKMFLNSG